MTVDLTKLTVAQVLGLTGAGEARSYLSPTGWKAAPIENMVAVMWTPIHRVLADPKRFGADVIDACFETKQYSCWNAGSGANHDWLMDQAAAILTRGREIDGLVKMCITSAAGQLAGVLPDTVNGATHYFAPLSMVPTGRVPVWARGHEPCAIVGDHRFYKNV